MLEALFHFEAGVFAVPKMKTKKAAAKRFKPLASGALKRGQAGKRHILTKKTRSRKNSLKKGTYVDQSDLGRTKRCLPYDY